MQMKFQMMFSVVATTGISPLLGYPPPPANRHNTVNVPKPPAQRGYPPTCKSSSHPHRAVLFPPPWRVGPAEIFLFPNRILPVAGGSTPKYKNTFICPTKWIFVPEKPARHTLPLELPGQRPPSPTWGSFPRGFWRSGQRSAPHEIWGPISF